MPRRTLETDYLVMGCGAAGMAFADTVVAESNTELVMVDRRHAPGGHWHDAYPFVRLHQPSSYYGVSSLPLGSDRIDREGPNAGFYERASAVEITAYYERVMRERLLASGRVRFFPKCEVVDGGRFVSLLTGEETDVRVRKSVVDARYLEPAVPATTAPPFVVGDGARVVPVGALARMLERADGFVIVGSGKTAADACVWLLSLGVPPEAVRWIKPREAWFVNRTFSQGGELVGSLLEGISLQMEAAALSSSPDELFARLEATAQLVRVDDAVTPTMYKAATMSLGEIETLRRIRDVVRLGKVTRIDRDSITLEGGVLPTSPRHLHVHCAARGLNPAPAVPLFSIGRITLQPIRSGLIPFNAAVAGFIETAHDDLPLKNRLCPPNRLPDVPLDWARGTLIATTADYAWSKDPAVAAFLERTRLNPARGLRTRRTPEIERASQRYAEHVRTALEKMRGWT
jgi:hypothetical protein